MKTFKLGKLPKGSNTTIPAMFQLTSGKSFPPIPLSWDWATLLPEDLGAMLNDHLGDCAIAAIGHKIQLDTYNTGKLDTPTDEALLHVYEQVTGYNPSDPSTDKGTVMQYALQYWQQQGVAALDGGSLVGNGSGGSLMGGNNKIVCYVEIDPQNTLDVKRAIYEFGGIYVGIQVQESLMNCVGGEPPKLWAYDPSCTNFAGGHAIWITGYENGQFNLISWGRHDYAITEDLFKRTCDECYAVVNSDLIQKSGRTPLGLNLSDWVALSNTIATI